MPLDTADCHCVVCQERFRVEAMHRGRRVACPHCLAQQMPQVIPTTPGSTTSRIGKAAATGGTGTIRRPFATLPTATIDSASLALFRCASCGFRARVPTHYVDMACPRCGTPGRAMRSGIPSSSGTTVIMTQLATAALDRSQAPAETTPPSWITPTVNWHLAIALGFLATALVITVVALGLTVQQASGERERLVTAHAEMENLRTDLDRLRARIRHLEKDLAAARTTPAPPVIADPETTTAH